MITQKQKEAQCDEALRKLDELEQDLGAEVVMNVINSQTHAQAVWLMKQHGVAASILILTMNFKSVVEQLERVAK